MDPREARTCRLGQDITGRRFGELVALRPTELRSSGSVVWLLACDCGQQALRSVGYLNQAMRNNRSPCCAACLRESRGGIWADKRERLAEFFAAQWDESGTLWTGHQTLSLMRRVRDDLEREFGPLAEDPVSADALTIDPAWRNHNSIGVARERERKAEREAQAVEAKLLVAVGRAYAIDARRMVNSHGSA